MQTAGRERESSRLAVIVAPAGVFVKLSDASQNRIRQNASAKRR